MISYWLVLLLISCLSARVQAEHFIDDQNTTIVYSQNAIPWNYKSAKIANNSADITKCYDQTYTVNQNLCTTNDACNFQIPFTGSGITIYVIQSSNPVNAAFTLDGNSTTKRNIIGLPATNDYAYNVTMFDVQSLAYAQHTLNVALLDFIYDNGTTGPSIIRFDYAAVNDTTPSHVAATPSVSPVPESNNGSHSKKSIVGPVVGGVVGGLALIAIIALVVIWMMKRSPDRNSEIDPEPKSFTNVHDHSSGNDSVALPARPYAYSAVSSTDLPIDVTPMPGFAPYGHRSDQSQSSAAPFSDTSISSYQQHPPVTPFNAYPTSASSSAPRSSSQPPSTPPSSLPPGAAEPRQFTVSNPSADSPSLPPALPLTPGSRGSKKSQPQPQPPTNAAAVAATHSDMTEEQAKFVADLYNNNVPAAEIARLMEVMRRDRANAAALGEGSSGGGPAGATSEEPPPSYDFTGR